MRKVLTFVILSILCLWTFQSCTNNNSGSENATAPDKENLVEEIKHLEDTLKAMADKPINQELANELIAKSKSYAEAFPEDEKSPAYLFRAGNVAIGISSFDEAVQIFGSVHQKYNDYERAADALFLQGFTYENHLQDFENAKKSYNDFLKRFPDHQLADQVRVVLQNIGKSPEDLVKDFQEQ